MNNSTTPERLIVATSTHWIKYVPRILFCHLLAIIGIALCVIVLTLSAKAPVRIPISLLGGALLLLSHHFLFHKFLSEEMQDIIVTNRRVIYFNDCLFLCDDEHEIPLVKVAAVEVHQRGLLQNLLDYGILWFDTGGGAVDIKRSIPNVPSPDSLSKIITQQLEKNPPLSG